MTKDWKWSDLSEGQALPLEEPRQISEKVYLGFLDCFEDRSPIHVDFDFACAQGFQDKVMHGNILNGFISYYVGMVFPGPKGFLLSCDVRYTNPCYLNDKIQIAAVLSHLSEASRTATLNLTLTNVTRGQVSARAKIQTRILADK